MSLVILPGTGRETTKWWRGGSDRLERPSVSPLDCHLPVPGRI